MVWNRRGVRYGFPVRNIRRNLATLLSLGFTVLVIGERASGFGGIRGSIPLCRFAPVS
jgi:hypothetical protein